MRLREPGDCPSAATAVAAQMRAMAAAAPAGADGDAVLSDLRLCQLSLLPALELVARLHPQVEWREQAALAAGLLHQEAARLAEAWRQGAAAQARSPAGAAAAAAAAGAGPGGAPEPQLEPLQEPQRQEMQQLEQWLQQLGEMESGAAAAALRTVHDAGCAPALLLGEEDAARHPLWAAALRAAGRRRAAASSSGDGGGGGGGSQSRALRVLLPAVQQIEVSEGVVVPVASYYEAAAAALAVQAAQAAGGPAGAGDGAAPPPLEVVPRGEGSGGDGCGGVPWPLTASAVTALLATPPGVGAGGCLAQAELRAVHRLAVEARLQALAAGIDLTTLVRQEAAEVQERMRQLRQGSQADPGGGAAADDAGAGGLAGSAVAHPAVAERFLSELAGFCRAPAAEELQVWLDICARRRNALALEHLPRDLGRLQAHQVEGLRQLVCLVETEQHAGRSARRSAGAPAGAFAAPPRPPQQQQRQKERQKERQDGTTWDSWLGDYNSTPQLLAGACELLGGLLGLRMAPRRAPPGAAWCREAYEVEVADASPRGAAGARAAAVAAAAHGRGDLLGRLVLFFDAGYEGPPFTAVASQGGHYAVVRPVAGGGAQALGAGDSSLQACTVAVVFPSRFCDSDGSSSSGDGDNGDGSDGDGDGGGIGRLSTLMHELGHALHFLLSATAPGATAADCACWAHAELCELPAHLTERMARDSCCLQVLLRHKDTGLPPPVALTAQLQARVALATRGAYQWQQHVMAALTDARLAAAGQGGGGGVSCCLEVLSAVLGEHEPLPQGGIQPSLLKYLPAAATLPGGGATYCYVFAELAAAAAWRAYLAGDPVDPRAGAALRARLFEAPAAGGGGGGAATLAAAEALLGRGSMRLLAVGVGGGGGAPRAQRRGWVPDLEHPAFQDIDLWG